MIRLVFVRPDTIRHPEDVRRMADLLRSYDYEASDQDIADAWDGHSHDHPADWKPLPESDDDLLDILLEILERA